ncbi:MAG: S1 family peptidase [Nocardioides sp.]|nr:S1 family peptidase [Nocardioides sp.]
MNHKPRIGLASAAIITAAMGFAAAPASSAPAPVDPWASLAATPTDQSPQARVEPMVEPNPSPTDVTAATAQAVSAAWAMRGVNEVVWDGDAEEVTIYTSGEVSRTSRHLADVAAGVKVEVVKSYRSVAELEHIVRQFTDEFGQFADGTRLGGWHPSHDGSQIHLEVADEAFKSRDTKIPAEVDGVVIDVKFGIEYEPALRVDNTTGVAGGALMQGQGSACTTGFPIGRSDGAVGNLSADHCGSGMGNDWTWGTSTHLVGVTSGQAYTGPSSSTDLEMYVLGDSSAAYIGWGSHVSWGYLPINGYFAAAVGYDICYSGAFSGSVCLNEVTTTNQFVCYGLSLPCYTVTRTEQASGSPAVGNGDSGGPAGLVTTRPSDGRTGFYGTGIISGMTNASSTCAGEPSSATRECSDIALFAPVEKFINNNVVWFVGYLP